jgi:hypothetical protein
MKTLDEICHELTPESDKASGFHDYLRRYEPFFAPLREQPIKFLEVGVERGWSAQVWLEYFTKAQIHGVDINTMPLMQNDRFHFSRGDQTSKAFWEVFLVGRGGDWDIVIDDGAHTTKSILVTLEMLLPQVRSGGYYIIEDLSCAYMQGYQEAAMPNQMDYVKQLLDDIGAQQTYHPAHWEPLKFPAGAMPGRQIEWLQFSEELVIIKKK